MGYKNETISSIVNMIESKKIYLPAIQRKYVWGEDQITKLMDSIMRGYPFGTFLFWKVKKNIINNKSYSLYEFIKDYHERDRNKNERAGLPFDIAAGNEDDTILSALDGQQRLTSLYIALKGSISLKLPRKHWSNDDAFPKKELYFNLLSDATEEDDIAFEFSFKIQDNVTDDNAHIWYRVKDIVQFPDLKALNRYILQQSWNNNETATDNITSLFANIKTNQIINYFEVESDSIDDVLDIFVRINSGGTVLSKTDLLFSTMVASWDKGRDEMDSLLSTINKIGGHYNFSNDFIMRICLYLLFEDISLKVESFTNENVITIKNNWRNIRESIKDTVHLLDSLGFYSDNILSNNAILPIVYFRFNNSNDALKSAKDEIRKFMVIAQIRHVFGQSTNSALIEIRKRMNLYPNDFCLNNFTDLEISNERKFDFDRDDIEYWFDEFEKNAYTFMLLTLLYPNLQYANVGFHQDHMHPFSSFENNEVLQQLELPEGILMDNNRIESWKHLRNTLANLQLLEGRSNESKNDTPLEEWLQDEGNLQYAKYIPQGMDCSLSQFEAFYNGRKNLMINELTRILLPNQSPTE